VRRSRPECRDRLRIILIEGTRPCADCQRTRRTRRTRNPSCRLARRGMRRGLYRQATACAGSGHDRGRISQSAEWVPRPPRKTPRRESSFGSQLSETRDVFRSRRVTRSGAGGCNRFGSGRMAPGVPGGPISRPGGCTGRVRPASEYDGEGDEHGVAEHEQQRCADGGSAREQHVAARDGGETQRQQDAVDGGKLERRVGLGRRRSSAVGFVQSWCRKLIRHEKASSTYSIGNRHSLRVAIQIADCRLRRTIASPVAVVSATRRFGSPSPFRCHRPSVVIAVVISVVIAVVISIAVSVAYSASISVPIAVPIAATIGVPVRY
jgi:hypothetical protein